MSIDKSLSATNKNFFLRYKKNIIFFIVGLLLLISAQLIKYFIISNKETINNWTWDDQSWIGIKVALNEKILWSVIEIEDMTGVILLQSFLLIFWLIILIFWDKDTIWCWLLIMWFGGLSNFINRLWYSPYVIDYLVIQSKTPLYFNLEDLMITVSFIMVCILFLKKMIMWNKIRKQNQNV